MKRKQQVATDRVEACPHGRVDSPFQSIDAVNFRSSLTVETDGFGAYVFYSAVFVAQVPVASQRHLFLNDFHDTMQHVVARLYLGQHGISLFDACGSSQQCLVSSVFQEWAHAASSERQCDSVSLFDKRRDVRQKFCVGQLFDVYGAIVVWHSRAAASSGRQCRV